MNDFFLLHVYLFLSYGLITINYFIIRTNYENFHVATKNYLTGICILPTLIQQKFLLSHFYLLPILLCKEITSISL